MNQIKRGLKLTLVTLAMCALFASTIVSAQTPLGSIAGTVKDKTGAVVANATITATNVGTNQSITQKSSSSGSFAFTLVPVGVYMVKVEAGGMKTTDFRDVKVDTAREYSLNAVLELGKQTETVEVTAGTELINTTSSEINSTVSNEQITALPLLDRNV